MRTLRWGRSRACWRNLVRRHPAHSGARSRKGNCAGTSRQRPQLRLLMTSMPVSPALLRAERLSRRVAERIIVDDVSLEVHAGEIVGILGPSGSGKSSLLRLLNRLDEPTSGTVFLEDTDYRNVAPRQLRRTVGMVMQ